MTDDETITRIKDMLNPQQQTEKSYRQLVAEYDAAVSMQIERDEAFARRREQRDQDQRDKEDAESGSGWDF